MDDVLRYDLIVKQGADYERAIPVLGLGDGTTLAGWSARGQVRAGYGNAPVLHTLDLTPTGTDLVLRIPAAVSSAWAWRLGRYDIEIEAPDGAVTRLVEGSVVVRPEITRAL